MILVMALVMARFVNLAESAGQNIGAKIAASVGWVG